MKYLFFDVECANCFNGTGKICEFGYVVIDEDFNELDKKMFIINPQSKFDWYVTKNMLAFDRETYMSSHDYLYYFDEIKKMFTDKDMLILGHTIDADMKYLNDEARRYNLPFFTCKFYDAKFMYNTFVKTPNRSFGVAKICDELAINRPKHEHKSVDDAYTTMLIVKEICTRMNVTIEGLIEKSEDCKGETCNGIIKTVVGEKARIRREEMEKIYGANIKNNLMSGENKTKFFQFLNGVKPQSEIVQCELTGKTVSISLNYEYAHFKEMLSIVQLLKNRGCSYALKSSESDVFISYEIVDSNGVQMECSRLNHVQEANANGATIRVIKFGEFLAILGVAEKELIEMPFPDATMFVRKEKANSFSIQHKEKLTITLGDILIAQGIDLKKAN